MSKKKKEVSYVLLKDIVIPKGTILRPAPTKTERHGNDHFDCIIGLSKNSYGTFEYCIDPADELNEFFTILKD